MSAFKRLVIETLVDKNHLSLINPILGNVKAHFSGRCVVTESIDDSSVATNIFVTIEGNMEFSDLEEVGLDIIKLNNLGCRVSFFDQLEKKRASHTQTTHWFMESRILFTSCTLNHGQYKTKCVRQQALRHGEDQSSSG